MGLPGSLHIVITSPDGKVRRRLPQKQIQSWSSQIERFGGYSQATLTTSIPYEQAGSLTLQTGDRVEAWRGEQRRYRGYVSAVSPSLAEPRTVVITALGASALLRKQFCDKAYAFPAGVDVAAAFSAIAQDVLLKVTGPGGVRLITSVQSLPIGTTIQTLDARRKLAGDALDALVQQAGNLAVWGVDVDEAGNNRLYLRPLQPASPPTHTVRVPGRTVERASSEQQTEDLVNQLLITGGSPTYPNLLHNGGFELPVYQQDGAGNLVVNGGFDTADDDHSVHNWTLTGGAQSFTTFSFPPKQAAPYAGTRCLGLEGTGQSASQTTACVFAPGHNYVLSVRAAKEIDQQIATGHATLQVRGAGGAVLLTLTVSLTPSGQGYDYFSGTFAAPAGATGFQLTLGCDANDSSMVPGNNGYSGGLLVDDMALYDVSVVYQDGWFTDAVDTAASFVNAVNWIYQDSVFEGGYAVYLDATAADADGRDLKLQPLETARFQVKPSQTLRYGVWVKSPPASQHPNPPKFFLEIRFYDGSGNLTRTPPRATFTPGFLPQWTYYELVCYALDGEVSADANLTFRSAGSLLVDAQSVRDAQAPAMAAGNGATALLAPYLPDGPLTYFLQASDAYLNGVWRPANGLGLAPYAGSEAAYGPRCGVFSDASVLRLEDACAVANSTFTTQAFPTARPSVSLLDDARLYWPGETVNLIGADGPLLSPVALPIVRVADSASDGLLKTTVETEREQPDISLVLKRLIADELRRASRGASSGASGGYSSGTAGGVTTGVSQTSQDGWTATTAEVIAARTRTAKAVSYLMLETRLDAMEADIAAGGGGGGGQPNASDTVIGVTRLSLAPASAGTPIAAGDNDPRLTNARTPTAHAGTHAAGGSDPVTPAAIGALKGSNNLSDITSAIAARSNLMLGSAAVANLAAAGVNASAAQVVRGDDTRLGTGAGMTKHALVLFLMGAYTPTATGADAFVVIVPNSPTNNAILTWNVRRISFRVEAAASGVSSLNVQRSTQQTAFNPVGSLSTNDLSVSGSAFQTASTDFSTTQVSSGDKLRVNVTALGTQIDWGVQVVLEEA